MKLVPIDAKTKMMHEEATRVMNKPGQARPWWYVDELPKRAILAISTGGGCIRKGATVYLIGGHDRTVFPDGKTELKLHEYIGLVEGTSWQPLCQLGREVNMV